MVCVFLVEGASLGHADPGRLGVMVDAGVPDGVTGSLVFRPLQMLRIYGGGSYNLISPGVRAGVSLAPVPFVISPSMSVEAGRYFVGDANKPLQKLGIISDEGSPLLREIGYDYANFHLGLDLGRSRFTFYVHAGFSLVRGKVRNLDEQIADATLPGSMGTEMDDGTLVEFRDDPIITLWAPSARLGFMLFY